MATSVGTLTVELEALTANFDKQMQAVGGSLDAAVSVLNKVGAAAGKAAGAIFDMGSDAVSVAADFEAAMTRAAIVTGTLGTEGEAAFGKLRQAAIDVASVTEFTSREAAEGIKLMGQAGFDTEKILAGLPKVLQLASAASVSVAKATDVAAGAIRGFGLDVDTGMTRVSDVMIQAANSSNTSFSLLAASLTEVAPIARNVGLSIEDVSAIIGKLGDVNIKGSKAGVALRGVLASMLGPSKAVQGIMKTMGLSFSEATKEVAKLGVDFTGSARELDRMGIKMTDGSGKLKDFGQILDELKPLVNDTGALFKIFGRRGGPAMAALLNTGSEAVKELGDKLRNSAGTSAEAAAANMATFNGRVDQLNSKLEASQIIIGDVIKEALLPLVAALDSVAQAFIDLPSWVTTSMTVIAGIAAAVLAAVAAFAALVAGIIAVVAVAAKLLAFKALILAIASAAAALGVAAGAIGAGILGAISILNQLHNVWQFFESDIMRGLDAVGVFFAEVFAGMSETVIEAVSGWADFIAGVLADAFDWVADFATGVWEWMSDTFQAVFGPTIDWLSNAFSAAVDWISGVWGSAVEWMGGTVDAIIPDAWQSAFSEAESAFPDFLSELKALGKNIVSAVGGAFKAVFEGVRDALSAIVDFLAAAAGFGLEVTGVQAGDNQSSMFGKLGGDLLGSLGFGAIAKAGEKLAQSFGLMDKEAKKAAAPRRRKAATGAPAERERKKREKVEKKETKAREKSAKRKEKETDGELKASRRALTDGQERERNRLELAKRMEASLENLSAALKGAAGDLLFSLGDFSSLIATGMEGFAQGGVWGAVIAVMLDLAKRTDGFSEAMGELDGVVAAAVDAIGPLTQSLVPLVAFLSDNLVAILDAFGVAMQFVGVVLSGVVIVVLSIFKGIADVWNSIIGGIDKVLSKFGLSIKHLEIPTGGLEDALEAAKDNIREFATGTEAATQEQAVETEQLRELNEQLLNAPQGFKVSLARFNATVREGASMGGAGGGAGMAGVSSAAISAAAQVTIGEITVISDDPDDMLAKIERKADWDRLKSTGTSRQTGGTFSSSSEQRFAR